MFRSPIIRLAAAALSGVAGAFALLALLEASNSGAGFSKTTAATAFGWMLPIVLGLVSIALARSLITESRRPAETQGCSRHCSACGGVVLDSWRLCPHCGVPLGSDDTEVLCH